MSGNVWEWTWDGFGSFSPGVVRDPLGPKEFTLMVNNIRIHGEKASLHKEIVRVVRGGSVNSSKKDLRISNRQWLFPSERNGTLGFRLVRSK